MRASVHRPNTSSASVERRAWVAPAIEVLPRLRDLTLQSGGGIPGGDTTPTAGGTVF